MHCIYTICTVLIVFNTFYGKCIVVTLFVLFFFVFLVLTSKVSEGAVNRFCNSRENTLLILECNEATYQWVDVQNVKPYTCNNGHGPCTTQQTDSIASALRNGKCKDKSKCLYTIGDLQSEAGVGDCDFEVTSTCIQGERTTKRTVNTTPEGGTGRISAAASSNSYLCLTKSLNVLMDLCK